MIMMIYMPNDAAAPGRWMMISECSRVKVDDDDDDEVAYYNICICLYSSCTTHTASSVGVAYIYILSSSHSFNFAYSACHARTYIQLFFVHVDLKHAKAFNYCCCCCSILLSSTFLCSRCLTLHCPALRKASDQK